MATKKSADTPAKSASKTAPKKTAAKASAKKSADVEAAAASAHQAGKKAPTHEEISRLAHQYWKERGHHHGSHDDDWHRAEQELKSRS